MTIRNLALGLSVATILSLNLILYLAAVVSNLDSIRPILHLCILVCDLSLLASSSLWGSILLRQRRRILGGLFLLNLGLFCAAAVLRWNGFVLPLPLLYGFDLYELNLYWFAITRRIEPNSPYSTGSPWS